MAQEGSERAKEPNHVNKAIDLEFVREIECGGALLALEVNRETQWMMIVLLDVLDSRD